MSTATTPSKRSAGLSAWLHRDPFRPLREEFDEMLAKITEGWNGNASLAEAVQSPSLDLAETDTELQLTMDLPGISADEVDIELAGNMLRVSGEHKEEKEEKGKTYHRIERRSGSFFRSVQLPCAVNEDRIEAECKNGVLKITLPKAKAVVTHKVKVKG